MADLGPAVGNLVKAMQENNDVASHLNYQYMELYRLLRVVLLFLGEIDTITRGVVWDPLVLRILKDNRDTFLRIIDANIGLSASNIRHIENSNRLLEDINLPD